MTLSLREPAAATYCRLMSLPPGSASRRTGTSAPAAPWPPGVWALGDLASHPVLTGVLGQALLGQALLGL
jgi:hypothetical protein